MDAILSFQARRYANTGLPLDPGKTEASIRNVCVARHRLRDYFIITWARTPTGPPPVKIEDREAFLLSPFRVRVNRVLRTRNVRETPATAR